MLETVNKENFNQLLSRFSTPELENLVEKFPYFQQAHLLLAKKYQQQSHPKFDQQLQLAALYTQDRELLFSIFNEKEVAIPVIAQQPVAEIEEHILSEIPLPEELPIVLADEKEPEVFKVVIDEPIREFELAPELPETNTPEPEVKESFTAATQPETETDVTNDFSVAEPHTFNEWLQAFSKAETPKLEFKQEEIPAEAEKQDEELEKLYLTNIPVNLQELVEEETHYSKGLDKFIEEQIQKHKPPTTRMPVYENELAPELITETMAKVYEMQKKYTKAIRCYEILGLKYPEKNDFFAARINYLKNII